jgi:tRNA threonylcarbamoyladenosine biosynthesis protein TsaB
MKDRILIVDTCGAVGSVVVASAGLSPAIVASASLPGRTASERLVATIKELTGQSGLSLQSVEAVVVVHGPGSFTGVRVGLSAAKGLCEALNLPLVAISRLAVLAHLAGSAEGARVYAVLDAGRGEYYAGVYLDGDCLREALLTREELLAEINGEQNLLSGRNSVEGAHALKIVACEAAVAESLAALSPQIVAEPGAEDALPLAIRRLRAGEFDDIATLDANYLRRTDAEIFAKPSPKATPRGPLETPVR